MRLRDKVILIAVDVPWLSEALARMVLDNGAIPCVLDDELPVKYVLAREIGGEGCQGMIEWISQAFGKIDGMVAGLTIAGGRQPWSMGRRIAQLAMPYLKASQGTIVHLLEGDFQKFCQKGTEPCGDTIRTNSIVLPKGWVIDHETMPPSSKVEQLMDTVLHFLGDRAKDETGVYLVIST